MRIEIHVHHHHDATAEAVRELRADLREHFHELKRQNMATKEEILDKLRRLDSAVTKIGTETTGLVDQVKALQEQIATAGDTVPSEISDAVDALATRIQAVDDLVPDPITPPADGGPTSDPAITG